jgi:putative tryptophan/tyrosine transport system substrate-binding protein
MPVAIGRRELIAAIGGATVAWPLAARAQPSAMPVIGFLHTRSEGDSSYAAFLKGLEQAGFVEGRSVRIEYRWAAGQYDRLATMAADLVRQQVNVLVAGGGEPSPLAAKAATSTIPIVFVIGSDPVKAGLVESYHRPGGNITGINVLTDLLEAKRVGLLHELVPKAATIGFLWNPRFGSAGANQLPDAQAAARALGLQLRALPASSTGEIDAAFDLIGREQILALAVSADPFLDISRDRIIALAARHSVPTMYQFREHTVAGGLMSYGIDRDDAFRQAGGYAARILKGEKPANLPVLQPTKFELVINLKAANALGLTIPAGVLAIADEVIE